MRRHADPSRGILLSFLLNLIFRFEWAVLGLILIFLSLWLQIPWFLSIIAFGLWIAISLIVTLVLRALNRVGGTRAEPRPNRNPYSQTNANLFPETSESAFPQKEER